MNLDLKKPCKDCPFKNDLPHQRGWLGKERAEGIIKTLFDDDQTFACHKTTGLSQKKHQHCAGAMILMERQGRANQYMRIMERLNNYDREKLEMNTPVFDTPEQFISWHAGSEVVTEFQQRQAKTEAEELAKLSEEDSDRVKIEAGQGGWFEQKEEQFKKFLIGLNVQELGPANSEHE